MRYTMPEGGKAYAGFSKVDDFMRSPLYVVFIACLSVLSSVFGLELIVYSIFVAIGVYLCIWGDDLLPLMPIVVCSYIAPSFVNNPGRNPESIFYPAHGGIYLLVLAAIFVACLIFRLVTDRDFGGMTFLRKKRSLTAGMLVLGVAYVLGGFGIENYTSYAANTVLFGFIQFVSVFLMYYVFSGTIKWEIAPRDYFAWIGLCVGFVVLVQLSENYISGRIFMEGGNTIDRELMATGWGMHNNIGGLMAMMMPFPFYLAYTRKRSWVYIALASVLMLGVVISCSRTAMLAGAIVFFVCSVLLLRKREKRGPILVVYAVAAVAVGVFAVVSFEKLKDVFALFIEEIDAISKRDLLFINGMKQFREYPVFGGTFYPQGDFIPWDWAELEAFSTFFPPRWHNTLVQIAASCGVVGLTAYVFHRVQTVQLFLRHRSVENFFIGMFVVTLLAAGLLDNHFFNVGPVLVYSMALAFVENIDQSKV